MHPVCQGVFPFSKQKWGTKETFGHFCLLCSGTAGRLQASRSHKSSPEMRLKYVPLHITHGMQERLHDTGRSYRVRSRSAITPAASAGVSAKPFGQIHAGGAPELLSTRLGPSPFQLP